MENILIGALFVCGLIWSLLERKAESEPVEIDCSNGLC